MTATPGQAAHAAACWQEGIDDADEVAALWQGLDDSELRYWKAVAAAAIAAQEPHAAAGLRADLEATVKTWREESEPYPAGDLADNARRSGFGYCAGELAKILAQHAPPEPQPAPELAAATVLTEVAQWRKRGLPS